MGGKMHILTVQEHGFGAR